MLQRNRAVLALAGVTALAIAVPHSGLRLNHTPSMPLGVWRERPAENTYAIGTVVVVCPAVAGWERVYLASGDCPSGLEPILKPVRAIAGDTIIVGSDGVTVNGVAVPNSAPLTRDTVGRPLHGYPTGIYVVAPGQVWLMVPRPDSLDSRYLGPVATADIRARATPLWVSSE